MRENLPGSIRGLNQSLGEGDFLVLRQVSPRKPWARGRGITFWPPYSNFWGACCRENLPENVRLWALLLFLGRPIGERVASLGRYLVFPKGTSPIWKRSGWKWDLTVNRFWLGVRFGPECFQDFSLLLSLQALPSLYHLAPAPNRSFGFPQSPTRAGPDRFSG